MVTYADGTLAAQTLDKFGLLIGRFVRFAAAHDVTSLAAVDRGLVAKFVAARGRTRHGVEAAVATMHNRPAALRAFYRTARRLRLILDDPTADIDLPARESSVQRQGATVPEPTAAVPTSKPGCVSPYAKSSPGPGYPTTQACGPHH